MTRNDIQEKIIKLVAQQLHIEVDTVAPDSTLESLGADSLDQVEIVMKVEEDLNIEMDDEKIETLKNLDQLVSYIETLV